MDLYRAGLPLRHLRLHAGFTQQAMSTQMKVAHSTWAMYELEITRPTPEVFERIKRFADSLGFCFSAYVSAVVLFDALAKVDPLTKNRHLRVSDYAERLGRVLSYSRNDLAVLAVSASLLDIGKIVFPPRLLRPRGPRPTPVIENKELRKHVFYSAAIVENIFGGNDFGRRCSRVALQHHERLDGHGFPGGLKSSKIDPLSKVAAVCDVFDSLVSEMTIESEAEKKVAALSVVEKLRSRSTQFDDEVLSALEYTVKNEKIKHLNRVRLSVCT